MRVSCTYGSVRGAAGDRRPYRDALGTKRKFAALGPSMQHFASAGTVIRTATSGPNSMHLEQFVSDFAAAMQAVDATRHRAAH